MRVGLLVRLFSTSGLYRITSILPTPTHSQPSAKQVLSEWATPQKHAQPIDKLGFKYMKAPLITRVGYEKLKSELDELWRVERPEVTKKVQWAASLGDRSENADYQYNKKRLREIDRRVRYLSKCLEHLKIVDHQPEQNGRVFFGAWVEVENDDGKTLKFRIVGYDEIFDRKDYISIDSPMARALLKKEVGDDAQVKIDDSAVTWYVNSIEYIE